ncbi:DUF4145 domain-containing protein [Salmonella enterica]|nr:DUF4145 domain-containing protein [Salmonella enterica]EKO1021895.1 DUF4145 domain-containing protein [Salmonella enterica subsp. enterica]EBN0775951.1 DUF4145 domain-containing protein [Salmonella enterica]ECX7401273.1 DUF4145 domain-containing protein [Salmonella enterica]EEC2773268.1 DUF4145 domain-containing protein [Salmonella enterica]
MPYFHKFVDVKCVTCDSRTGFSLIMCTPLREKERNHYRGMDEWVDSKTHFRGLFTCNNCHNPACIEFHFKSDYSKNPSLTEMVRSPMAFLNCLRPIDLNKERTFSVDIQNMGIVLNQYFSISLIHPEGRLAIPEHLPENIRKIFVDDLMQTTSTRFIVMACRSIIEAACRDKLGEDSCKKSLVQMINMLIERGELGSIVGDWAHVVRQLGNEVVHRFDAPSPDAEEAKDILNLTVIFLELLYTYPAKIQKLKEKSSS